MKTFERLDKCFLRQVFGDSRVTGQPFGDAKNIWHQRHSLSFKSRPFFFTFFTDSKHIYEYSEISSGHSNYVLILGIYSRFIC